MKKWYATNKHSMYDELISELQYIHNLIQSIINQIIVAIIINKKYFNASFIVI